MSKTHFRVKHTSNRYTVPSNQPNYLIRLKHSKSILPLNSKCIVKFKKIDLILLLI